MSILIKGMEMPKEDEEITIRISPNGIVMTEYSLPITGVKAVSIPPHGKLIDIEPFMRGLYEEIQMGQITYTSQELYDMIDEEIKSMPTIIESECE